jgi:hypothetical protein
MRLNEVRGIGDAIREAYLSLPPPSGNPLSTAAAEAPADPYAVLGVPQSWALDEIEDWYKVKAKRLHPDVTDDDGKEMSRINAAMDAIRLLKRPAAGR